MVSQHFRSLSMFHRPSTWTSRDQQRPWLLHYRSSKWFILLTVVAAVFTDVFLYAVIVPVVPFSLRTRVGIPEDQIQSWISILIAVYGGALAVASPFCGWAADATPNRRLPLVMGLAALGSSTIMLNLGRSIAVLIAGRVLQGISAAVVWCVGLALVADTVVTDEIGKSMGYVFVAMSVSLLAGPLIGGVVFDKAGYNAVFATAYALIGVDIALRLFMIEKKDAKKWTEAEAVEENATSMVHGQHRDWQEMEKPQNTAVAATPTTTDVIRSEEDDEILPMGDTTSPENFKAGCPTTSVRSKTRVPTIITLLKSRRLLCALWACLVVATLFTQFDSVLPLFVKETFGWNSTAAGLIFIPLLLPSFLSPIIGWAIDKYGPRWFSFTGFLLLVPLETLLRLVTHNSFDQKVLLCALLTLMGLALNLSTTPLLAEITYVVEQKEKDTPGLFGKRGAYAQAYGLFNLAWAGGCLVGPIWGGFVRENAGWGTMTWSFALLSGVTAVPVAIWTGGSIFNKRKSQGRHQSAATTSQPVEKV